MDKEEVLLAMTAVTGSRFSNWANKRFFDREVFHHRFNHQITCAPSRASAQRP